MEKGTLKLKLKLGSTPEPPPMDDDSNAIIKSEEEEDQDEQEACVEDEEKSLAAASEDGAREKQHKKSKKKKKKKEREKDRHRHKRDRSAQDEGANGEGDDSGSKRLKGADGATTSTAAPPSLAAVAAALKDLLTHLLRELEKRDVNQFFVEPVTDAIAPGYSTIISQPMCFATMRDKVQRGLYTTLKQYEDDVKLIVSNCLKYNGPDTVYYSAGKRLLAAAQAVLSREKLLGLRKDMPNIGILPRETVGVNLSDGGGEGCDSPADDRTDSPNTNDSRSECDDDDDSEEEAAAVSRQAAEAARTAATALHRCKPASTMGYLKPCTDGSVALTFLSGCEGTAPQSEAVDCKPLNMGLVLGKLSSGSSTLHNYHDDKRTMAKPVKPIHYGSFSSFCPSYDSTFANLSKEESDLVRATYGNETAVQYAESICEFSRDCSMATTLVDQLLNLLTSGQHSRTRATIATQHQLMQQRLEQQQLDDKKDVKPAEAPTTGTGLQNLRSLSELGIDVSFLDTLERAEAAGGGMSGQLAASAELVQSLATEQTHRLSKQSAQAPLVPSQPSYQEMKLADRLTLELVSVARQLPPSALLPAPISSTSS